MLLRIALALLTASRAQAQVGLQLEAGLDGKIRLGNWAPVRVTVTNTGAPVTGHVQFSLPDCTTAVPLELPAAAKKRVETTLLSQAPSGYGYFRLSRNDATAAFRSEGRELATAKVTVQVVPEAARLLVVCGETAGGLRFLDGVSLADAGWSVPLQQQAQAQSERTVTAHPSPAAMPSGWTDLDAADLLVMRDAAWGQLEPEQRRAVRRWVEMGGHLLLCGEDPSGFGDEDGRRLLPVRFLGPRPKESLSAFPLPDREPIRAAAGRVMTLGARPLPDAQVSLRAGEPRFDAQRQGRGPGPGGEPLLVARPTGFGTVLWLGFDPFRVPPERETVRRALWAFLIGRASGAERREPAFPPLSDVAAAYDPVKTLPHFPTPSRWTLGSFGLAYAAVFGPLNLWLLRRLRRTVRAWLLMPALSLGMTGGVLALGTTWGRARVVFHAVTVLEAMAGSGTARELTYAALFSPTSRGFGLEIDDPSPIVRVLGEQGNIEPAGGSAPGYRPPLGAAAVPPIREGDRSRWEQVFLALWNIQPFQVEQAADLGAGVRMDLDAHLSGQVTNGTADVLRSAYLQYRGWRCLLGDLPPGAVRRVATAGWKRRRLIEQGEGPAPTAAYRPGPRPARTGGDDLFTTAGSLLRGSLERQEVLLIARRPSLSPPVHIPGVVRTPSPGLDEGAILVVRAPIAPPSGFSPDAADAGRAP